MGKMSFLEFIFEYSGLIFAIGGLILAIPGFLAFHYNYKHGETWPLRSTVPATSVFVVFILAFYALYIFVGGYYLLATIGMIAQTAAWGLLIAQRVLHSG